MQAFDSQTVVVTGGGSGLGRAVVQRFVRHGARTMALDVEVQRLDALRQELGDAVEVVACDVTDFSAVERVLAGQAVDVLINSAGIAGPTNIKSYEVAPADLELVFRVNVFGCFNTSKAVLPGMVARGYGRVLHIASIAGKEGNAGMVAYSASKAAVIGMTKVQGKEVAGSGVTVNALAPAVIRTPMVAALPDEQVRYMTDKIPMQRCGTLDELVAMVEFIVSPQASFTTAFTFDLSGGRATY